MKQILKIVIGGLLVVFSACKGSEAMVEQRQYKSIVTPIISEENARSFDYFFLEAGRHKINGDFNKALNSYQKCLTYDPNSAVVYFELGNIYLAANNVENALQNFRMAVNLNPENEWYQLFLASVYVQIKDNKSAIASYEELSRNFPSNLEYNYRLALLYSQEKNFKKAIEKYNRLETLHGMEETISLEKFKLYLNLNDKKAALEEIDNLVRENPDQARYRILMGDAYLQLKEYKKSLKSYNEALKINPNYGQAHLSLAGYYELMGDSLRTNDELRTAFKSTGLSFDSKMPVLVQVMMKTKDNLNQEALLEELVNILLNSYPDEAELHYYYGNYLASKLQKEEAIQQFNQVVELDPDRYDTWLQLAGYQMELKDYDSLISVTNEIILHHPTKPEAYLYKGVGGFSVKDYQLALDAFLEGIKYVENNKPLEGQFYANIGDAYHFLGSKEEAFAYYEKALVLDDHNIMVLNNYSYYLSLEGKDLDKAERMSAKCVELEPGNSTYLDTYAWVLFKKKDYFLARFYIEQAIDNLKENNGVVVEHYGDILYMLGEQEKALLQWIKAKEQGSDGKYLDQKIEQKIYIEE